ncbi:uncharacterized protein BP5553_06621 [Venustampulla echinocandica]|uniref:Uncharacterized protein n=1 Tax=Venustampulla echinocandica TaxID=2656787 RepID=A0A370TKF8_9HELO|nr:uncharacterized protein BP5553_06621 [Venustampulla echinocandica]RDL36009.1 hypothetical protein BP5553_06621 [Venustampulla echinocandica]
MSMSDSFIYVQFHPLAYIIKLNIELSMADLISKIVRRRDRVDSSINETGISVTQEQAKRFLEDEASSLDTRYRPRGNGKAADILRESEASPQLNEILERCKRFDSLYFASATLQEVPERELSPEIEQERQVERPLTAKPKPHKLHEDALATTSAAAHLEIAQFPRDLLVTLDFARTVMMRGKKPCADAYQLQVQWILTSPAGDHTIRHMVIISPFEAQKLMPVIEKSAAAFLHLYAPRTNLAFRPLDDLELYSVPPLPKHWCLPSHLPLQLNLFSGQLYFRSFEEYMRACDFLRLAWHGSEDGVTVEADGFIVHSIRFGCMVVIRSCEPPELRLTRWLEDTMSDEYFAERHPLLTTSRVLDSRVLHLSFSNRLNDVTNWVLQLYFEFLDQSITKNLQLGDSDETPALPESNTSKSQQPCLNAENIDDARTAGVSPRPIEEAFDSPGWYGNSQTMPSRHLVDNFDLASQVFRSREAEDFSMFQLQPDLFAGNIFGGGLDHYYNTMMQRSGGSDTQLGPV